MNRGLNNIYNQISSTEDLIEYDINLYNSDNNIFITIPLFKSNYGNIGLSLIYTHLNKNVDNLFGKGFKLNYYNRVYNNGSYVLYETADKSYNLYNNLEIIDKITYEKNYDNLNVFESLSVSDYYGNYKLINNGNNYPTSMSLRNGSELIFTMDIQGRITKIKDNLTNDEIYFEYNNNLIIIYDKVANDIKNKVELHYSNNNELLIIKYKLGDTEIRKIDLMYYQAYNLYNMYDANNLVSYFRYNFDSNNKILSIENKDGLISNFEYYLDYTNIIDEYNNITKYGFKDNKISYVINNNLLDYYEYDINDNLIYLNMNIELINNRYNLISPNSYYSLNLNNKSSYTLLLHTTANKQISVGNNTYIINGYKLITIRNTSSIIISMNDLLNLDKIMLLENKDFNIFEYNNYGYKTKEINCYKEIEYTYDNKGNVLSVDDSTNINTYTYDSRCNLLTECLNNNLMVTNTYSSNNNLSSKTEGTDTKTYQYYGNKISKITYQMEDSNYYDYDMYGNLIEDGFIDSTNPNISYCLNEYTYDSYYRQIKKRKKDLYSQTEFQIDLETSYINSNVNTKTIYYTGINQYGYEYLYDSNNRLEEVQFNSNQILEIEYDNNDVNRIESVTKYGLLESYIYNTNNTLSSIIRGSETINYIYDLYGSIKRIYQGNTLDYEYDYDINRNLNYLKQRAAYSYFNRDLNNNIKTKANMTYGYTINKLYNLDDFESKVEYTLISNNRTDSILFDNNLMSFKGLRPREYNVTYSMYNLTNYVVPTKLIYQLNNTDSLSVLIKSRILDNNKEVIKLYDSNKEIYIKHLTNKNYLLYYFGNSQNIVITNSGYNHTFYIYYERIVEDYGEYEEIYYNIIFRIDDNEYNYTVNEDFYFNNVKLRLYMNTEYLSYIDSYETYSKLSNVIKNKIEYNYDSNNRLHNKYSNIHSSYNFNYSYDNENRISSIYSNNALISHVAYNSRGYIHYIENHIGDLSYDMYYGYDRFGRLTICYKGYDTYNTYEYYSNGDIKNFNGKEYVYTNGLLVSIDNNLITYSNTYYMHTYKNNTYNWTNNRLSSYSDSINSYEYKYNSKGLRVEKKIGNVKTEYYYDEQDRIICERNNNTNQFVYYLYNLDGIYGFMFNNNIYYYIIDIEGKIIGFKDSSGFVCAKYRYSPYGEIVDLFEVTSLTGINHIKYKTYYYDDESNMYYLKSRYYLPEIGRFISPDDINYLNPDDMYGYNLYAYCNNNPIMYSDPDGNLGIFSFAIIAFIAGTLIGMTVSDIKNLNELKVDIDPEKGIVKIKNSFLILTPWVQYFYSIYLNHINVDTKNLIKGSSFGVQLEWMVHNISYYINYKTIQSADTDLGATFLDNEKDVVAAIMTAYIISCAIFGFPVIFLLGDIICHKKKR